MNATIKSMAYYRLKTVTPTPTYPSLKDMETINTLSEFLAKYLELNKDNEEYAIDWLRIHLYQTWDIWDIIKNKTLPMLGKCLTVDSNNGLI